jgi:hypothetical protein
LLSVSVEQTIAIARRSYAVCQAFQPGYNLAERFARVGALIPKYDLPAVPTSIGPVGFFFRNDHPRLFLCRQCNVLICPLVPPWSCDMREPTELEWNARSTSGSATAGLRVAKTISGTKQTRAAQRRSFNIALIPEPLPD